MPCIGGQHGHAGVANAVQQTDVLGCVSHCTAHFHTFLLLYDRKALKPTVEKPKCCDSPVVTQAGVPNPQAVAQRVGCRSAGV